MTGIIKTDQLQGAQSSTIAVPSGNNLTVGGTLGVTGETTLATHLNLGDNDRIKLGAGSDIQIYHDGTYSRIMESGGTALVLDTTSTDIRLTADNSKNMATFVKDGAVQLYHSNSQKFSTTSSGVTVTGNATISGELQVDTNTLKVQASDNRVGIGTGSPNYARLNIASTAAGAQERGLYIELTPASGTSPNNIAVFSATNSNMTQPLVRIHHESPTADQLMLQCTTTGSNTVKFSVDEDGDVYTAGGINVGGTGTANKLDDYEEGTFSPGLIESGGGLGANLTTAVGQYTKVGILVTFALRINGNARNSTGNQVYITGLPFTFSPATSTNRIQFEVNGINLGLDSNMYGIIGQLANTDTSLTLLMQGTTLDNFRGHDLTPSYEIYVHGSYFTS